MGVWGILSVRYGMCCAFRYGTGLAGVSIEEKDVGAEVRSLHGRLKIARDRLTSTISIAERAVVSLRKNECGTSLILTRGLTRFFRMAVRRLFVFSRRSRGV